VFPHRSPGIELAHGRRARRLAGTQRGQEVAQGGVIGVLKRRELQGFFHSRLCHERRPGVFGQLA
jgi:hypothetical protein